MTDKTERDPPRPIRTRRDVAWVKQPEGVPSPTKYQLWGAVSPPSIFGLPDGLATVIPAGTVTTLTYPLEGEDVFRWGTLSRFRREEDAIAVAFELAHGIRGNITDNNLIVELEAADAHTAFVEAVDGIEDYLDNISVTIGLLVSFAPAGMQTVEGIKVPMQRSAGSQRIVMYDLEQTRAAAIDDQVHARLDDARLDRALDYYAHAKFLENVLDDRYTRQGDFLNAAIFLNYWKAASAIVGDSTERDFQSRYKKLGFSYEYFTANIEFAKKIRDDFDVAHFDLSREKLETVAGERQKVHDLAREVILRYRAFLLAGDTLD